MLCIFVKSQNIWEFSSYFLLLITNKFHCALRTYLYEFYTFQYTVMFFMGQNVLYLVECPYDLQKDAYSALVGWNSPQMLIRSSWFIVLFGLTLSLLIFCLLHLAFPDREVLKFLTRTWFVYFCLQYYRFLPHVILSLCCSVHIH